MNETDRDLAALAIVAALLDVRSLDADATDCAQLILNIEHETDLVAMGRMFACVVELCEDGRAALRRVTLSVAQDGAETAPSGHRPVLGAFRRDSACLTTPKSEEP